MVIAFVVPSNPAALWVGPHPTKEQIAAARIKLGLDKPLYAQYFMYMSDLLRGDFGVSVRSHQSILTDLKTYLPATLELVIMGMIMAVLIGIPLGVLSGARKDSLLDHTSRLLAVAGVSMPTFWMALLLQFFFFGRLLGGGLPVAQQCRKSDASKNVIRVCCHEDSSHCSCDNQRVRGRHGASVCGGCQTGCRNQRRRPR